MRKYLLLFLLVFAVNPASAQDLRQVHLRVNEENINQTLASTILFSAQRTLAGGQFFFDPDESGAERTLTIAKFPGRYTFEDVGTRIHPTIEGLLSFVKLEDQIRVNGKVFDSSYLIEGYSVGLGGGLRADVDTDFFFYLGARLVYSHLNNALDNGEFGDALEEFVSPELFNWELNALSIIPKVDFEWQGDFDWGLLQLAGEFVYFRTESTSADDDLLNVDSESFLTKMRVEGGRDLGLSAMDFPLSARVYYELAMLMGDFRQSVDEDLMHTTGVRLLADTDRLWDGLFDNVGLSGTYVWGDDFYGWLVGLGINY